MKPLSIILQEKGGAWLGAARDYIKRHANHGERVIWGSEEPLTMTAKDFELMASEVAEAAIKEHTENLRGLLESFDRIMERNSNETDRKFELQLFHSRVKRELNGE